MRCSVIIPVHNRASLTLQCLETIFSDPAFGRRYEVVVVDDGSTDGTSELLASFADRIRVVIHETAAGFAIACNDGAAAASGDDFVFLNNDTMPVEGWLDKLVEYAEAYRRAAVIGAKLLFPNDTIQHAGMIIAEDLNPRHIYAGFPADHPAVNRSRRFPIVTAACALFRRRPFEDAGGFDDAFKNGFEDVDLCLRLSEQGYEIHYCHESIAYHLEMGTRDFRNELPNLDLYRRRWAHKVQPDAIPRYLEDGLLRIDYGVRYPFRLELSPLLGIVGDDGRELDRALAESSAQVSKLQRENLQLRLLVNETGLVPPPVALGPSKASKPASLRAALFVSGAYGDALRYRCDHYAEALKLRGATADARWLHQVPLDEAVEWYECFILHHVPAADEHVERFVKEIQRSGKVVIFDADAVALGLSEQQSDALAIDGADAIFVATEPLARLARKASDRVFVIPNVAGKAMLRVADQALDEFVRLRENELRLGYVAGQTRHDRDFLEAAEAVLWAFDESPNVRLVVVGEPTLDRRFDQYRERIEQLPFQPWDRLLALLSQIDVNLVPLEGDDPVAESTSCTRWLEAALVARPTIASPRPDFVRVIKNKKNGLLAETPEDWREALAHLIESPDRRFELGRAASEDVRRNHTTEARSHFLYDALADVVGANVKGRKLTINWLVGSSEGRPRPAAELIRLAGELGWLGHRVRLFAASVPRAVRLSVEVQLLSRGPFPPADVAIASDAETARLLEGGPQALFSFFLAANGQQGTIEEGLTAGRLSVDAARRIDAETFERTLLDRCFARLRPAWKEEDEQ